MLLKVQPSYLLLLIGMLISHTLILELLNVGLAVLLYQDKNLLNLKVWQKMIQFWFIKEKFLSRGVKNSFAYSKTNFHPSQKDSLFLVKTVNSYPYIT